MSMRVEQALATRTATELVRALREGEISAVESVEARIARIEQVDPAIHAVVVRRFEEARREAQVADARRARGELLPPLHGLPITVKECFDLAGTPSTFGLPTRAGHQATADDPYVARLRAAGAIVLGKTNVAQLLFYNETDNPLYGRTNNPWNLARTPGGSSGGEAALIAAGGSALGLATDWGGSTRVPAALTGLVALKPTAGRFPDAGRFSLHPGQRALVSQTGLIARSVADITLGMEALHGDRLGDADPRKPFGYVNAVDVGSLRVAYYTDDGTFTVAPAVRRAVLEAAGMLAGRGAEVTEWQPPDPGAALDLFYGILSADGGTTYRRLLRGGKRDRRVSSLATFTRLPRPLAVLLARVLRLTGQQGAARMVSAFGHRSTTHYWDLVEQQRAYRERFARALATDPGGPFDVVVCPAFALPAFPHGATGALVTAGAYAVLYNVLGYPAGVVPVTRVREEEAQPRKRSLDAMQRAARSAERGSGGLPIGVQVVARPWQDHLALAAMAAIEQAARAGDDYPVTPITPREV